MKQTKSKTRMDGSADVFIDGRLTSGRVACPLADLVRRKPDCRSRQPETSCYDWKIESRELLRRDTSFF